MYRSNQNLEGGRGGEDQDTDVHRWAVVIISASDDTITNNAHKTK